MNIFYKNTNNIIGDNMKRYSRYKNNTGEFIPSFYKWKTPEEQKRIANRLANITKSKKED